MNVWIYGYVKKDRKQYFLRVSAHESILSKNIFESVINQNIFILFFFETFYRNCLSNTYFGRIVSDSLDFKHFVFNY